MRRTTVLRSKKHFWAPTKTFRAVSSGQYAFPTVSADSACVSFLKDPTFSRDPSGCTAVAALVTHDRKIFVVSSRILSTRWNQ